MPAQTNGLMALIPLLVLSLATSRASAQEVRPLNRPFSTEGRIQSPRPSGSTSQDYRFSLRAGQRLSILVNSDEIDPVVSVHNAENLEVAVASDDDSGEGYNAALTYPVISDGIYVVRVSSYFEEAGRFTLRIEPISQSTETALPAPTESTAWHVIRGSLSSEDSQSGSAYFDDYRIQLASGETILVLLDSSQFDTVVRIFSATSREQSALARDNDDGVGNNSMLAFVARAPGDYIVRASSHSSRRTGDYVLRVGRLPQ